MRTNIVIDEALMKEAFKFTTVTTKRDLVDLALREFIENHKRKDIRKIKGKIKIDENYDHKKLRAGN